MNINNKQTVFN